MTPFGKIAWAVASTSAVVSFGNPEAYAHAEDNLNCRKFLKIEHCVGRLDPWSFEAFLSTVRMLGHKGVIEVDLEIPNELVKNPRVTASFSPSRQDIALDSWDSTDRVSFHGPLASGGTARKLKGCYRIMFDKLDERGGDSTAVGWNWDLVPSKSC